MARFADALEDALRPVHDAGRGDALRIVRDERAGGEAAGVVGAVGAALDSVAAQAAEVTRRVWGHAAEGRLVDEETDRGLAVVDGACMGHDEHNIT